MRTRDVAGNGVAAAAAIVLLAAGMALPSPVRAQAPRSGEDGGEPISRSSLRVSIEGQRDRREGGDSFRAGALSIRGSTILAGQARLTPEGFSAWGIVGGAEARLFATDLPEVVGDAEFLGAGLSLGAFYAPSLDSSYAIHAGAFLAEQLALLGSPQIYPRVVAIGTQRTSPRLRLLYGLGYTYQLGRGLPLPFLGVAWRFAPAWRLDVLLPARAIVTWDVGPRVSLDGGARLAGDLFRYRARDTSGADDEQTLRIVRLRLGVAGRYAITARTYLGLELGAEGASVDTGLSKRNAAGAYLGAFVGLGEPSRILVGGPAGL